MKKFHRRRKMYNKFPNGNILNVDLNEGKVSKEVLPGEVYRLYPGGSALGLYLAMMDMKPGIDPFG
jgi:aldehyde:ferredoxin oxidoreductase